MELPRRRPAVPVWSDVVLAAAFLAVALVQIAVAPIAGPVVSVLVALGCTVPIAWRRAAPTAAARVMTATWTIPTPNGYLLLGYVMAAVVFYSLGAYVPELWRVLAVSAAAIAVGVVATLLGPEIWQAAIGSVLVVAGPVAAGRLVAHQRAQNQRLRELTEELVRERSMAERVAVAEERARIARELHDAVGHEVTVIALQADAAAAALARAPERAAAPVAAIRRAAAEALAEMRRVVGILRDAEDDGLHVQPGLADLPELVEQSRAAGIDVRLVLEPPPGPLSPSLELAAYRVVQEALTNARRHAPGSAVSVRVGRGGDMLCVEVLSTGGRPGGTPGGGHGLVGMRERVRLHGGSLDAGPTEGGFAVRARLPLAVAVGR